MAGINSRKENTSKKCLKGASAFLKTQIALLRAGERSPETTCAIKRLKACIKILNEGRNERQISSLFALCDEHKQPILDKGLPTKAHKPGAYVKNFFEWLSATGVALPVSTIQNGLDLKWSVRNLDLWRPLFATKESLTEADRTGRRYWSKPFNFAGTVLYVNSQWYGNKRGYKQKTGFDTFAVGLASSCGLSFSPYVLPSIPEIIKSSRVNISPLPHKTQTDSRGVTIQITSSKKKTFRFKG